MAPAFAASRPWRPADITTYASPSPPKAPTAYLSSRLSLGGFGLAPITELPVHRSGRSSFAHYPEQLGGGAYAAYDAFRGGEREREPT